MEEFTSGKQVVADSEKSCESEFNAERSLSCAAMSTKTFLNQSSPSKTGLVASNKELVLDFKNSENQSNGSQPFAQKELDDSTITISGETQITESETDVSHSKPENATISFKAHSDNESTSHTVSSQNMTSIDNNNVYSDVGHLKPETTDFKKRESATVQLKTDNRKLSCKDNLDSQIVESSERCEAPVEKKKLILDAGNKSESKYEDVDHEVKKMFTCVLPVSVEKAVLPVSVEKAVLPVSVEKAVLPVSVEKAVLPVSVEKAVLPVSVEKVVLPVSVEKAMLSVSVEKAVQHDAIDPKLDPEELACNDEVNKVIQENKVQRNYILGKRKSQNMQDASRKPGGKLTSLLERLNAERGAAVASECSMLNASNILTKSTSKAEAETGTNQSYSSESSSPSGIGAEATNTEQPISLYSFRESSSSATDNSPVSFIQIQQDTLSKKARLTFKSSTQTDSSTGKQHEKSAVTSSNIQTSESKRVQKNNVHLKIIKKRESGQSGLQNSNESTSSSLLLSKPTQTSVETGKGSRVCVKRSRKGIASAKTVSVRSLGQQTLISTDNEKYVLDYASLKGSDYYQSVRSKGDNPSVGSVVESYPKPSNEQTVSKPKHQFSLLKHLSSKQPTSVNSSTIDISKVPTIYSLLANSPATIISSSKPQKHSTSESVGVNIPTTTSNLSSRVINRDLIRPSIVPGIGPNRLILAPHNPGKIIFQPVPYSAITNSNCQSSWISTLDLSKLAAATRKKSKGKAAFVPNTSLLTTTPHTTSASFVVPAVVGATPVTKVLAKSTSVYSKSDIPVGIATVSNISSVSTKTKVVKTTTSSTANSELSPINQHLTDTHQSCSTLITKIAQKSLSHTSANRPAVDVLTSLTHPLDSAVKPQTAQETSKPTTALLPSFRIIVSKDSSISIAGNSGLLQAEDDLSTKDATLDRSGLKTYTTDMLTVSKILQALKTSQKSVVPKTSQTSVAVSVKDLNKACQPVQSSPKPVKVTASCPGNIPSVGLLPQTFKLVMPKRRKAVSLLNTSSMPTIQHSVSASIQSSPNVASTEEKHIRKKLKSEAVKAIRNKISGKRHLKMSHTTSSVLNPSFTNMAVEMNRRTPRKSRDNAVYSATVRTGQGPVSVMVVAPDIEDNSSDTDTAISSLRFPLASKLDNKGARGLSNAETLSNLKYPEKLWTSSQDVQDTGTYKDENLLYKGSETGMLDLRCHEELEVLNHEQRRFSSIDEAGSDTLSDIEVSPSRFFRDVKPSDYGAQHRSASLDEEETDSDLDIGNNEEQDMSVLRQLLIGSGSTGLNDVTSKQLQTESNFKSGIEDDIINRRCQLELGTAHKTHLTSCFEKSENKLSSTKTGSIQQLLQAPFMPELQNGGVSDQTMRRQSGESDFYGLKIESIFSLSNNADLEEFEFSTENNTEENNAAFPVISYQSLVFNIRDSHDWKNFVSPCFVVLERLPKSEILAKGSSQIQSKCSEHCRKRTLDYLCNLKLLKCVNHPEAALFLKPTRGIAVKRSQMRFVNREVKRREMPVNETIVESSPQCQPLLEDLKQELPHELVNKPSADVALPSPFLEDTIQTSLVSKPGHFEMDENVSLEQDGKKTNNTMRTALSLNFITSSKELKKFLAGLKRLKKQVGRKRAKMLNQKLTRKSKAVPLVKRKTKLAEKKPHRLPLTRNLQTPAKIMKYTAANRTTPAKQTVVGNISSAEHHTDHLPDASSGISHHASSPKNGKSRKVRTSFVKRRYVRKNGISPVSANTTQHALKVPIPKLRTGANVVSIQPKMQPLPAEKVKAALQSLNSYLEATGRKPTEGNTQYILLKIEDQHILVKLPFGSASTALLNNVTLSNVKTVPAASLINQSAHGGVSEHSHMQNKSGQNIEKNVSNNVATDVYSMNRAHTAVSNMNTATVQTVENMNSAIVLRKTASDTAPSTIIRTSSNTALVSSIAKKANPDAIPSLRIMKTANSYGIVKKNSTHFAKKTKPLTIPHQNHDQNISSVQKPAVNALPTISLSSFTSGTSSSGTNTFCKRSHVISLLKPIVPSQSQPTSSLPTQVYQMRNVSSNAMSSVPVSISSHVVPGCFMKASSGGPSSIVLSNLPSNSSLLPERKRKLAVLSEEARKHKRRRMEAKYPLPPGIVIKSEPDDLDYEFNTKWTDVSRASDDSSFSVMYTEHTLSKESSGMYNQGQDWSAYNSDKTRSSSTLTTDQGLETQHSRNNLNVINVSAHSPSDMKEMLSAGPCENMEDTLDEPPPLVDETASTDDMKEIIQTYDIVDTQEDMPPVLQPMFTSSCSSLVEDTGIVEIENASFTNEKPIYMKTASPHGTEQLTVARDLDKAVDSTSGTSLHSDGSLDSGIGSNIPSNSSSYTSVKYFSTPASTPICKNLKIQHLKELLKKKEMEIENMKKLRTEFPSLDLDHI